MWTFLPYYTIEASSKNLSISDVLHLGTVLSMSPVVVDDNFSKPSTPENYLVSQFVYFILMLLQQTMVVSNFSFQRLWRFWNS